MTDHKFTDDDVIKALELCSKLDFSFKECDKCPYKGECGTKDGNMPADALALINRQKAEIERLNKEVDRLSQCVLYHDGIVSDLEKDLFNAKADAIKEFAEAVKIEFYREFDEVIPSVMADKIDGLVKEMTEESKR